MNRIMSNKLLSLIKNDIVLRWSTITNTTFTILAVLLLFNLVSPQNIYQVIDNPLGYFFLLYVGGFIVTSSAFRSYHDKKKSYFTLMLPCSSWERFLSKLLLTSILYAAVTLFLYSIFYWLIGLIIFAFHRKTVWFNPLQLSVLKAIAVYIILQSVVLMGSVYFKKHVIMKTILSIACFGIVLVIFVYLVSTLLLHNIPFSFVTYAVPFTSTAIQSVIYSVVWVLLAPFCWLVTYQRVKEIEV